MTWAHDIRVEVWIPDPAQVRGRLGVSSLGTLRLHELDPSTMTLGTGRLGTGRLHPVLPPTIWWDLTPYVTSITATTGGRDDVAGTPDPGRLDLQLADLPRLVELGIRTGTRIQVVHDYIDNSWDPPRGPFALALWSGRVEDVDETHLEHTKTLGARPRTTIVAFDVIRELATITRWGTQEASGTDWDKLASSRFRKMATTTGGIGVSAGGGGGGLSPDVTGRDSLHSTNLVDWLTICAASTAAMWRVTYVPDADSLLWWDWLDAANETAHETFTDRDHAVFPSYYQVAVSAGGTRLWSQLDATLHTILNGNTAQEVITYKDKTAIASIGTRAVPLDMITQPADVPAIANRILARRGDPAMPTIQSITIDGPDTAPHRGGRRWYPLRPLSPVAVYERGRRHDLLILNMRHDITPDAWRCTLTLIPCPYPLTQDME